MYGNSHAMKPVHPIIESVRNGIADKSRLIPKGNNHSETFWLPEELVINKPWRWDKKWRIVIYDIKELKRSTRKQLRKELINLGFVNLSSWKN